MKDVLYLCDRKACDNCNPECNRTLDISHAVSFKNMGVDGIDSFWEKESKPLLVFKTDLLITKKELTRLREDLKRQMDEGLILVDGLINEIRFKEDSEGKLLICQVGLTKEQLLNEILELRKQIKEMKVKRANLKESL